MTLYDKIRNWSLFRAGQKSIKEIVTPFRKIDPDEQNWIPTGVKRKRDLFPATQDWISDVAYYQWLVNPLAGRIIEILCDFVIGSGMTIVAKDDDTQKIIDEMWFDEINNFPEQQISMCQEFTIFGELLFLPFVNPVSGLVLFSRPDPTWISDVIPLPGFPQVPDRVVLKSQNVKNREGELVKELKIIRRDRNPASPTSGQLAGDAFYFYQNKIGAKRRGHTQLLRTHEWIDIYSKRLFNEAERQELANAYVWDVTLEGANDEDVKKFIDSQDTPQNASIRAHNENVKWNVLTPDLKSADFETSNRQFLQVILGAYGIPEHFFALGGEVNFATAKAMSEPTLRAFQRQQRMFKTILEGLTDYQLEKAEEKGRLSAGEHEYEVVVDEISMVDTASISAALSNFAASLSTAESQGWLERDESSKAFAKLFGQSGVEIKAADKTPPPGQLVDAADAFMKVMEKRKKKKKPYA